MDSGSTDFTVALVPTAMNAGVWISPCGVVMVPVRPRNPPPLAASWAADGAQLSASRVPTVKENSRLRSAAGRRHGGGMAGEGWLARFQCASLPPSRSLSGATVSMWGSSQPASHPRSDWMDSSLWAPRS